MDQREKLIELIQKMYDRSLGTYGGMADFLLANGVVVLPEIVSVVEWNEVKTRPLDDDDYKELIERLRDLKKATLDGWTIGRLQAVMRMDGLDAADAIEQLEADNESYKCAFADLHNEIANCFETIDTLEKERDAAVADLHELFTKDESPCAFCVAEHCDKCIIDYPYWEWRGVKEDNDEID